MSHYTKFYKRLLLIFFNNVYVLITIFQDFRAQKKSPAQAGDQNLNGSGDYSPCIQAFFANNVSCSSSLSGSGTQQSTGQTAAH